MLALEVIAQARQAHPKIELREVDLVKHPEVAVKYGVLSTPALIINGELAWEGVPSVQALWERIGAYLQREAMRGQ
jgi:protein-disulfide isomerase